MSRVGAVGMVECGAIKEGGHKRYSVSDNVRVPYPHPFETSKGAKGLAGYRASEQPNQGPSEQPCQSELPLSLTGGERIEVRGFPMLFIQKRLGTEALGSPWSSVCVFLVRSWLKPTGELYGVGFQSGNMDQLGNLDGA